MKYIFVLALLIFIQSCTNNSNPTNSISGEEILPLNIGNSWTKISTQYDTSGNVIKSDTVKVLVERDTIINYARWYISQQYGIVRNDGNGLYQYIDSTPVLIYKYPSYSTEYRKIIGSTVTTVETNISISTLVGVINCYHYLVTWDSTENYKFHYYFSPGIGEVLFEGSYLKNNKEILFVRTELVKYKIL